MTTPSFPEYLAIDNEPLSTPAWSTEDIATILNGPGSRGTDLVIPGRAGQVARRRVLDARQITIPVVVNGFVDKNGLEYPDPRTGLVANLDELKRILAPKYNTLAGTRTLLWTNGVDIYRTAEIQVSPDIQVASIGPNAARIVITATIPSGVFREAAGQSYTWHGIESTEDETTFTFNVFGNGEVQDAEIVVAGRATWPGPYALTTGSGAPAPGSGSTGDWYFDTDGSAGDAPLYGPRDSGGNWPGPFAVQYGFGAPQDTNISRANYWVTIVDGQVDEVYGARTISNPHGSSFLLENLTYDAGGGVFIHLNNSVHHPLTINCGTYYAELNGNEVSGKIVVGGTPVWLPLQPGENTLRMDLGNNTVDGAINILYQAVWL